MQPEVGCVPPEGVGVQSEGVGVQEITKLVFVEVKVLQYLNLAKSNLDQALHEKDQNFYRGEDKNHQCSCSQEIEDDSCVTNQSLFEIPIACESIPS